MGTSHFSGLFRFLLGIMLVQAATAAQVVAALRSGSSDIGWLLGLLSGVLGLLAALWFSSIVRQARKEAVAEIRDDFIREREKIRVQAEREKAKVVRQSQQQLLKDRTRTQAKANFKVGASVAGAVGIGALMLFTQFMTFGLLALTTTGGAVAGYAWRVRRELGRPSTPTAEPLPIYRVERQIAWEGARKAFGALTTRNRSTPVSGAGD